MKKRIFGFVLFFVIVIVGVAVVCDVVVSRHAQGRLYEDVQDDIPQ